MLEKLYTIFFDQAEIYPLVRNYNNYIEKMSAASPEDIEELFLFIKNKRHASVKNKLIQLGLIADKFDFRNTGLFQDLEANK